MLNRAETRFKADGRQTVDTRQIILPVQMRIQRSDAVQALAEARRIVDQLRRMAEEAELPNARLAVPDLDADKGPGTSEFLIEQKSAREVRLSITLAVSLALPGDGRFWSQAAAIAAATDLLQGFAIRPHEKGVEVDIQQAKLLPSGERPPEPNPKPSA